MSPTTAPYGSWKSPITPELLTRGLRTFSMLRWDADDLYWLEHRPEEKGRGVILRWSTEDGIQEITGPEVSVGTRVHEYGGGDYAVRNGILYYVDARDQRIYRQVTADGMPAGAPRVIVPITPEPPTPGSVRYADFAVSPDGRWILAVRETHPGAADSAPGVPGVGDAGASGTAPNTGSLREPRNDLVRIPADGSSPPVVVAEGHDFFASPRLSPDGTRLAFLSWDHPCMPWDGTDLWIASLGPRGEVGPFRHVAGGPRESIFQPEWSPDGRLHFASDRTGWWNVYEWIEGEDASPDDAGHGGTGPSAAPAGRIHPVTQIEAEIGAPQWVFGGSHFAFLGDRIACVFRSGGLDHLGFLEPHGAHPDLIRRARFPYTSYGHGGAIVSDGRSRLAFLAGAADLAPTVAHLLVPGDLSAVELPTLLRRSTEIVLDPSYLSRAEAIEFPTTFHGDDETDLGGHAVQGDQAPQDAGDGAANAWTAHALFYPPTNRDFVAPEGTLPPLIVKSHGGPTSCSTSELALPAQFWTSRGFAVVDVNYGGSSGYGRAYRERLAGRWGIVDTDDCIAAARYLAARGLVDGRRMAIRGGSAGGFTTLSALVFHDVFSAGASSYGVADLETLATDTHKFESRYLDGLVGPYPERRDLYVARSPVHAVDRLSCPVILLQGAEDEVVPPSQSEAMVRALAAKGLPHAYVVFEGERHGFRQAANIRRALEAEYLFYAKVFGFSPADDFAPLEVAGLS